MTTLKTSLQHRTFQTVPLAVREHIKTVLEQAADTGRLKCDLGKGDLVATATATFKGADYTDRVKIWLETQDLRVTHSGTGLVVEWD